MQFKFRLITLKSIEKYNLNASSQANIRPAMVIDMSKISFNHKVEWNNELRTVIINE